jgi:hypothetical protein
MLQKQCFAKLSLHITLSSLVIALTTLLRDTPLVLEKCHAKVSEGVIEVTMGSPSNLPIGQYQSCGL